MTIDVHLVDNPSEEVEQACWSTAEHGTLAALGLAGSGVVLEHERRGCYVSESFINHL